MRPRNTDPLCRSRQRGFTLTELMVSLVLGSLVVLAATAMVAANRGTYRTQDETTRLAESTRIALELSNRLIRLAGYTNFGDDATPPAGYVIDSSWAAAPNAYAFNGPHIVGADNSTPLGGASVNGSDALTIRFFGSSPPNLTTPDGNVLDCAGFPVPKAATQSSPTTPSVTDLSRAYNVLFIAPDPDGEPALKCQRQTFDVVTGVPSGAVTDTQTLIRGVEDFQVQFGEWIPQAGGSSCAPGGVCPPPAPIDLDNAGPASIIYRDGIGGANPVQNWSNIHTVRIGILLRSATGARTESEPTTTVYHLFGAAYPSTAADFSLASLSALERTRARRVVTTTVFIRNRMTDWQSINTN